MTTGPQHTGRASLWMIGTIISFSVMAVAGREVGGIHDTFETMLYRSIVSLSIIAVILPLTGAWRTVSFKRPGQHILRNLFHFTGQNLWFLAVGLIPLAQVFALEFSSPLWVIALSPLFLGERLTWYKCVAGLLGFIGILIVTRPGADSLNLGIIAAGLAAVFFAFTTIMTKQLTRFESVASVLFWLTLTQTIFGAVTAGYDGDILLPTVTTAPWLLMIGVCGLSAHFCLTNALSLAPATVVTPIDFARLPAIAIVGMILYGESLDLWVFIGAALIFAANFFNISMQNRHNAVTS
ncbi:MAG: DMT family transporter [Paracoccaceae bacterium]